MRTFWSELVACSDWLMPGQKQELGRRRRWRGRGFRFSPWFCISLSIIPTAEPLRRDRERQWPGQHWKPISRKGWDTQLTWKMRLWCGASLTRANRWNSLSHTHTRLFLWKVGTSHRFNGFYTVQTVCAIALHLNLALTGDSAFQLPPPPPKEKKNSLCMIYKRFEKWGHGAMSS